MTLERYRYVGENRTTFMAIQRPDGSTLEVDPNETFTLAKDPKHPEIVKVGNAPASLSLEGVSKPVRQTRKPATPVKE